MYSCVLTPSRTACSADAVVMRPRLPLGSGDRRYREIVAAAMREGIYDRDVRVALEASRPPSAPTPA
jgi:hypothetical protein